jgi:hypothetical protein
MSIVSTNPAQFAEPKEYQDLDYGFATQTANGDDHGDDVKTPVTHENAYVTAASSVGTSNMIPSLHSESSSEKSSKVCHNWSKLGACKFGKECKFAHPYGLSNKPKCIECQADIDMHGKKYDPLVAYCHEACGKKAKKEKLVAAAAAAKAEEGTPHSIVVGANKKGENIQKAQAQLKSILKQHEGNSASVALAKLDVPAMDMPFHLVADHPIEEQPPAVERDFCRDLRENGICRLGRECPDRHFFCPPVALPTLDPEFIDGSMFRIRKDPYLENPENGHLRVYEPIGNPDVPGGAYKAYYCPSLFWAGLEMSFSATGTESAKMHAKGIGSFIDWGEDRRVVLLSHVVDAMRVYFTHAPRSMSAAEFYVGAQRCVRVTGNLRMTNKSIQWHKHYATLVAYCEMPSNSDNAGVQKDFWNFRSFRKTVQSIIDNKLYVGLASGCLAYGLFATWSANRAFAESGRVRGELAFAKRQIKKMARDMGSLSSACVLTTTMVTKSLRDARDMVTSACTEMLDTPGVIRNYHAANRLVSRVSSDLPRSTMSVSAVSDAPKSRMEAFLDQAEAVSTGLTVKFDEMKVETRVTAQQTLQAMTVGVIHPVLEETAKHISHWGAPQRMDMMVTSGIVFLEMVQTMISCLQLRGAVARRLLVIRAGCSVMHFAWAAMPLNIAIGLHSMYNLFVSPHLDVWASGGNSESVPATNASVNKIAGMLLVACIGIYRVVRRRLTVLKAYRAMQSVHQIVRWHRQQQAKAATGYGIVSDKHLHKSKTRIPRPTLLFIGEENAPTKVASYAAGASVAVSVSSMVEDEQVGLDGLYSDPLCVASHDLTMGYPQTGSASRRLCVAQYGFGIAEVRPTCPAKTIANELAVMEHRVCKAVPTGDFETLADFIAFILDANTFKTLLVYPNGTPVGRVRPMQTLMWLHNLGSAPEVKAMLRKTHEDMKSRGIHSGSKLSLGLLRQIMKGRKVCMKKEGLSLRSAAGLTEKAYRPFFPTHPEALLLLGPWCAAFQAVLYKCWGPDHFISIGGQELKMGDIGEAVFNHWVAGWCILEDDCGTWDMTMNEITCPVNTAYVEVYSRYGCPVATCQVMRSLYGPSTYSMGALKAVKKFAHQSSGLPDTFSRNCIHNAATHLYILCRKSSMSVRDAKLFVKMFLAGDDNLLLHAPQLVVDWTLEMGKLGLIADGLYRDHPSEAGFCSGTCFPSSTGYRLTPNPGRFAGRSGLFIEPPRDVEREQLVRGTALCNYEAFRHIPPIRAMLDRYLELTAGFEAVYPPRLVHKLDSGVGGECTTETWEAINHRYPEWNVSTMDDWNQYLATLELGDNIDFPAFTAMAMRDTDGPKVQGDPVSTPSMKVECGGLGEVLYYHGCDPRMSRNEMLAELLIAEPRPDGPMVEGWGGKDWALSRKARNRAAHAMNGNTATNALVAAIIATTAYAGLHAVSKIRPKIVEEVIEVYVRMPNIPAIKVVLVTNAGKVYGWQLYGEVCVQTNFEPTDFYLTDGAKQLLPSESFMLRDQDFITLHLRLRGGTTKKKKSSKKVRIVASSKKKGNRAKQVIIVPDKPKFSMPNRKQGELAQFDGKSWGRAAGSAVGGLFGMSGIGGVLGNMAHKGIKTITGVGDYKMRNEAFNKGWTASGHATEAMLSSTIPKFATTSKWTVFAHSEIMESAIYGSTNFTTKTYALNPGLPSMGRFLSNIAPNFTSYRLLGAVITFQSMTSENFMSATGATGTLMMASQYDVIRKPFRDSKEMLGSDYSCSSKPSRNLAHLIECDKTMRPYNTYYVRTNDSGSTSNEDLRLSDWCNFTVATEGMAAVGDLGQLHITYVIAFETPMIRQSLSPGAKIYAHLSMPTVGGVSTTSAVGMQMPSYLPGTSMLAGPVDSFVIPPFRQVIASAFPNFPIGHELDVTLLPIGRYCMKVTLTWCNSLQYCPGYRARDASLTNEDGLSIHMLNSGASANVESPFFTDCFGAATGGAPLMFVRPFTTTFFGGSGIYNNEIESTYQASVVFSIKQTSLVPWGTFIRCCVFANTPTVVSNSKWALEYVLESMPDLVAADSNQRVDPTVVSMEQMLILHKEMLRMQDKIHTLEGASASSSSGSGAVHSGHMMPKAAGLKSGRIDTSGRHTVAPLQYNAIPGDDALLAPLRPSGFDSSSVPSIVSETMGHRSATPADGPIGQMLSDLNAEPQSYSGYPMLDNLSQNLSIQAHPSLLANSQSSSSPAMEPLSETTARTSSYDGFDGLPPNEMKMLQALAQQMRDAHKTVGQITAGSSGVHTPFSHVDEETDC